MADKIRNVGPKSAAWLRQVGVRSVDDLRRIGVIETFLKVKRAGFRPSLNLLYSMEGALVDCHWADLSDARKRSLVAEAEAAEAANPIRNRWDKQAMRSHRNDGVATSDTESSGSAQRETADDDRSDGFGDDDHGVRDLTGGDGEFR